MSVAAGGIGSCRQLSSSTVKATYAACQLFSKATQPTASRAKSGVRQCLIVSFVNYDCEADLCHSACQLAVQGHLSLHGDGKRRSCWSTRMIQESMEVARHTVVGCLL